MVGSLIVGANTVMLVRDLQGNAVPINCLNRRWNVTSRLLPRRFRFDARDEFLVVDEGMKEVAPCVGGTTSIGKHLP